MSEVKKGIELLVTTPNEVGTLGKLSATVAQAGIDFITMSAWGEGNQGYFKMLTSDNLKATQQLKSLGYQVDQKEVLLVEVDNKPGALAGLAKKIADAGINIDYCYGAGESDKVLLVFATQNNEKAYGVIKQV